MNKRVYFLMIVSFVIGMVELIISGILDLIAEDLNVSLGQAGYLITIFSLIFAIASPVLLLMTSKIERKKLTLVSLVIFLFGNMITVIAPNYAVLFTGRVVTALSGALLIILCLVIAPSLVESKYRGRAIGIVSMGVSASLVLGVPIGILLGNTFGWRAPFLLITILTILSIIGVYFLMDQVAPKPGVPLRQQLATLKSQKISFAHITTFLYMTGHTVLYAYLKPYLQTATGMETTWISVVYFLFGIAAVAGGGLGGTLADLFGSKRSILFSIIGLGVVLLILPITTNLMVVFLVGLMVWGMLSWLVSPAMQTYLIETTPSTSDIQQSLSNSSLHLGIAVGSLIGGIVVESSSIEQNPIVGGFIVIIALFTAVISIRKPLSNQNEMARIKKQIEL
ncbi:MFS transporter [Mesobacillus maritimus]|uniref:MFS transporter n=1 Tax=Mesobacillus maritimus TaxID=1643336 RepID=UPI00203DC224|nr:MFS transporter [Mesobacillus maritimus]MCM3669235.1 MFS transporter [Mesobacillus maritimus]